MTDRVAFSAHHRGLLQLEREAEVVENERLLQQCSDAELVARGAALLRLQVADLEPGFGGRLHAVLRPSRGGDLLSIFFSAVNQAPKDFRSASHRLVRSRHCRRSILKLL